jgi:hypothetical protein
MPLPVRNLAVPSSAGGRQGRFRSLKYGDAGAVRKLFQYDSEVLARLARAHFEGGVGAWSDRVENILKARRALPGKTGP